MTASTEVPLEDAFDLGIKNLREGNPVVAEQVFRDILKAMPDHYPSLYYLSLSCYYNNNFQEALAAAEKALEIDDGDFDCWNNYGIFLSETGNKEKALDAFEQSKKLKPDFADAYGNMANSLWEMGRPEEAKENALKAIELYPEYPDAYLSLGNALVDLGQTEEAIEAWDKASEIDPEYALALNNKGNALRDLGRLNEAEEACRKALELKPDYPHALNNLANALRDLGQSEEAEKYYRRAIELMPSYAQAHNNLCVCLMDQGRHDEAVVAARYATSFKPDYAEGYLNLSMALSMLGKIEDSEKAAQQALSIKPDSAEAHIQLANVFFMRDRYPDAEALLKKAQDLAPESPRIYLRLAQVQERAQKTEEAFETINKAVAENPEMPDAYMTKASICQITNRLDEAIACIEKALELRPKYAQAYITLSEIYVSRGDLDKAQENVEKARELNPELPGIYYSLSHLKKYTEDDEDFKKLLTLKDNIEKYGLAYESMVNYALYRAYEDMKNYDEAFKHLKAANDAKRKIIPYDQKMQQQYYSRIKQISTPERFAEYEGLGDPSDIPVFILGMPRSGTTLTEQIISSHPDVYGAGELSEIPKLDHKFGNLTKENAAEMGAHYVAQVKKLDKSGKARRITDKMPGNFMRLGQIVCILPYAKIIHCRRDPADTCLSCYKQNFARGQYWSYNLEELAAQYKMYKDLMEHWRKVLPGKFLEIDYEETVNNFEEQARKLIDYVGLPWDDACLEPHKQKRDVLTASKTQVIRPVYKSSVKSWQRYEKQLEPLFEGLEYDKEKA